MTKEDGNKKLTPRLRFKDKDGREFPAWEQCKLEELLIERRELAPSTKEYPLMAFIANQGVAEKGERYDRSALTLDSKNKKYKKTEAGDFIYSSNNLETGSIGLNRFGKATISPVYSIFQPTSKAKSDFLGVALVRTPIIQKMIHRRQGVIYGQWRIHESDFLEIEVPTPSGQEQEKIGAFFEYIEDAITLHQRKLTALKKLKKSLLQKLFPKNESSTPELRFSGFSDDWEQCEFVKSFRFLKNYAFSRADLRTGPGVKSIHYGDILTKFSEVLKADKEELPAICGNLPKGFDELRDGDVIFADTAEDLSAGKTIEIHGLGELSAVSGLHTIPARPTKNFAKFFLGNYLNSPAFRREIISSIQGTKVFSISKKTLLAANITAPADIEEQKKIGSLLCAVQDILTLHEKKVNTIQNLKKALLQQMFV